MSSESTKSTNLEMMSKSFDAIKNYTMSIRKFNPTVHETNAVLSEEEEIHVDYYLSESSENESVSSSDDEDDNKIPIKIQELVNSSTPYDALKYKTYNFLAVEKKINRYYFDKYQNYSSALDILASYLKGQKLIYMESKVHTELQLNWLMMPSILLSTAATVLGSVVKDYTWGTIMISSVNGVIACLLAVVNYLKLDAASEAHKISAHQYDKLQTSVEFLSGSVLLFHKRED